MSGLYKNRNGYIDCLRFFGLICLIIAHTNAPSMLKIARSFDVPLMVFISALCVSSIGNYWDYVKKRVLRIYKPVVIFLSIFFIFTSFGQFFIPQLNFGFDKIVGSYLLLNHPSIGYVWIMRVFILVAFIAPVLLRLISNMKVSQIWITTVVLYIITNFATEYVCQIEYQFIKIFLREYVLYLLGYSIIIIVGLWAKKASDLGLTRAIVFIVGVLIIELLVNPLNPTMVKYPPHGLYILYGLMISLILWRLRRIANNWRIPNWVTYTSKDSMWLYLWHIVPAYAIIPLNKMENMWVVRFLIVLVGMYTLNWIFQKLVRRCGLLVFIN